MKQIVLIFFVLSFFDCYAQKKEVQIIKTHFPTGELRSETETIDGKKNGKETLYLKNGDLFMVQYFKDNLPVDSFFQYKKGDVIIRGHSILNARVRLYDAADNQLIAENDYFENGVHEGFVKLYYKNSRVAKIGEYHLGKKNGLDIAYYINGNIKRIVHYKDGIVIPPIVAFDSLTGKVIEYVPISK